MSFKSKSKSRDRLWSPWSCLFINLKHYFDWLLKDWLIFIVFFFVSLHNFIHCWTFKYLDSEMQFKFIGTHLFFAANSFHAIFFKTHSHWTKLRGSMHGSLKHFSLNRPLGRFSHRVAMSVCLSVCPSHPRNHASRRIRDLWSKGISLILAYL